LDEHATKHIRLIRHDSIDAEVEKSPHLISLVDRPHMDLDALSMEVRDELRPDDGDATHRDRDLDGVDGGQGGRDSPATGEKGESAAGTGADRQALPDDRPNPIDPAITERADHHPGNRVGSQDDVGEWPHRGVVFRVEIDMGIGKCLEKFFETHDRFGAVDASETHVGPGKLRDGPARVGDSIESVVVECDGHAVAGDVDIGLDVGESQVEGMAKRLFGVLRMRARPAPVSERDRTTNVEIRVNTRHAVTVVRYGQPVSAADRLTELLSDNGAVPLDEALLLLAEARPGTTCSLPDGIATLDRLAGSCPGNSVDDLIRHVFVDQGFSGDRSDFHDPRNSFLDEVLDRRVGMPITLAVVLVEVGRRMGIILDGVGMPGHFLVRERDRPDGFIDPYHQGVRLGSEACEARFHAIHGPEAGFHPSYLDPVAARSIVQRVLNNLTVAFRSRDPRELDWLLDIRIRVPADPPDLRALADLCELRGRYGDAADLLDRMHEAAVDGDGDRRIRDRSHRLRSRLN